MRGSRRPTVDGVDTAGSVVNWVRSHPRTLAAGIGAGRMAFGLAALLGPNTVPRLLIKADASSPDAMTAWRMAGGRDVVLGLGTLVTAGRNLSALREWLGAGVVVDTIDLAALAADDALHPLARATTALVVAIGAVGSTLAARRLPR